VIIGAPTYSTAFPFSVDRGRVDVYSGVNYGLLMSKLGDHAGDELGYSVCGLGDVNGDGKAEVLAGAPYDATNGNNAGLVRKFDSSGVTLVSLYGPGADDNYGISLAKVPDVDGDGIPEYAIGTEAVNNNGYVELREGDDDTLLWTYLPPDSSYTDYGFAVAGGDVNGDGVGDVVVGAPTRTVSGVVGAGSADVWLNINAKTTSYGAGYPGTLGIPDLSGLSDPGIGTTFVAGVTNSRGAATTGLVIVGFSRLNVPTSAGGTLLVAPFEIVPISIPATGVLLSGSLPNDPALIGVVVDLQVLEFDPGAGHRLSFTPGLELLIGVDYP
jgi:hypothetical protein